ncbi:MAG: undecaprenyldiphospho-muramoylpentapeptide beta-N-acetylglucosaminyltransferase [Polyangiaceae bacterium]|jgi:UDP-N-acetylglucosamine--N-acetylmuramyl-(pentapeptide) pyrophosphoryl-undecaprenol N-acetylglucosamine transferase
MSRPTIVIAGGGTGGHVFPGVAVAEALQLLADVEVVFCGTDRGVEARVVPARGWRLERLDVAPIKGGGLAGAMRGAIVAARATWRALALVRRLKPRAVLSVGGYAAGPVALAGALLGVPVAVLEPNSVVGLANRLLAPFARRAYLAWDEAAGPFRAGARRAYGVPLRRGFSPRPYVAGTTARVLVMGGSQGAAALNERMPEAVARLGARVHALEVTHQAGRDRDEEVRSRYAAQGVTRVTVVPFIEDIAAAIAEADVVVARAGAVTVAELTAIGRASVLVPFPFAADDHQAMNAAALARAGGATCIRQAAADPARLSAEIQRLLEDGEARVAMADASRALGRPDATRAIAADLLALAAVEERGSSRRNGANGASLHASGAGAGGPG